MEKMTDLEWILGRLSAILDSKCASNNLEKIQQITELVRECKEEIGMEEDN